MIAGAAAGLILAGVYLLASRIGGPGGRGQAGDRGQALAENAATPTGQPPAEKLKVDRLRDAFNAASAEPRVILSLSPT